jgi:hypothetical protein
MLKTWNFWMSLRALETHPICLILTERTQEEPNDHLKLQEFWSEHFRSYLINILEGVYVGVDLFLLDVPGFAPFGECLS